MKNNATLMLMGSAKEYVEPEMEKPVLFAEDMSEEQLHKALELPGGLTNLGNTCYLNATLQCMRSIPELRQAIITLPRVGVTPSEEVRIFAVTFSESRVIIYFCRIFWATL